MLTAVLAVPVGAGFLLLVAGGAFADAMAEDYGWSERPQHRGWNIARWPVGVALLVLTIAVLLDHAPRRRQPGTVLAGTRVRGRRSAQLARDGSAGGVRQRQRRLRHVYGPLAGMFALLLWASCPPSRCSTVRRCAPSSRPSAVANPYRRTATGPPTQRRGERLDLAIHVPPGHA